MRFLIIGIVVLGGLVVLATYRTVKSITGRETLLSDELQDLTATAKELKGVLYSEIEKRILVPLEAFLERHGGKKE